MRKRIRDIDVVSNFSQVLQDVSEGHTYVVTTRGEAVAIISPVADSSRRSEAAKEAAKSVLLERLESLPAVNIGRWTRDELYE